MLEQAPIAEHPHRLDRVQGYSVRGVAQPSVNLVREPGHKPGEQFVHRGVIERIERQRRCAARGAGERGMAIGDLGPGEGDDEDGVMTPPVEEVLDKRDEPFVCPMDVLEDHHERALLGQPLEEASPGGEEVLAVRCGALGETQQVEKARLEPGALFCVGNVEVERRPKLCGRAR